MRQTTKPKTMLAVSRLEVIRHQQLILNNKIRQSLRKFVIRFSNREDWLTKELQQEMEHQRDPKF
jgi:hypothetical protein